MLLALVVDPSYSFCYHHTDGVKRPCLLQKQLSHRSVCSTQSTLRVKTFHTEMYWKDSNSFLKTKIDFPLFPKSILKNIEDSVITAVLQGIVKKPLHNCKETSSEGIYFWPHFSMVPQLIFPERTFWMCALGEHASRRWKALAWQQWTWIQRLWQRDPPQNCTLFPGFWNRIRYHRFGEENVIIRDSVVLLHVFTKDISCSALPRLSPMGKASPCCKTTKGPFPFVQHVFHKPRSNQVCMGNLTSKAKGLNAVLKQNACCRDRTTYILEL